ncbi:hypothetical protein DSO57_1013060 [Entomophthora muscae]|uniref:Uncharacterized protein n=1 Tax=Entomophthora muscae TaxID=34485 RepID=A0ACC2TTX5_9FUNG|nr:hypothetical protein DSO57_1013060 [Entomophthora muscae]
MHMAGWDITRAAAGQVGMGGKINEGLFLAVGLGAVMMNLLLIVLVVRMRNRKREIKYALVLSVLDILLPCTMLVFRGTLAFTGFEFSDHPRWCSAIGAGFYVGVFSSLMLVMLVAAERYRVMFSWDFPRWMVCLLGGYVVAFLSLVMATAAKRKFVPKEDGFVCAPDANGGGLSQASMVMFGVSLMLFLVVTLFCYIRILFFVAATTTQDIEMNQLNHSSPNPKSHWRLAPVAMRTTLICAIYFTLVTPSCFALVLLGFRLIDEAGISRLATSLALYTLCFANPFLVIFAHSATFERLVMLFKSSKKNDVSYAI